MATRCRISQARTDGFHSTAESHPIFIHTWTPPHCQAPSRVPERQDRDCCHTSGLDLRRKAAGPDGIRWPTPNHLCGLSRSRGSGGLNRPRSDLSCHHAQKRLCNPWWECCARNSSAGRLLSASDSGRRLGAARRDVPGLIVTVMREQRPDDARVLVGERHCGDIGVAPLGQACQPPLGVIGTALQA